MEELTGLHRPLLSGVEILSVRETATTPEPIPAGSFAGLATHNGQLVLVTALHVMAGKDSSGNDRNPRGGEAMYQGGATPEYKVSSGHLHYIPLDFDQSTYPNEIDAAAISLAKTPPLNDGSKIHALFSLHNASHSIRPIIRGARTPQVNDEVIMLGMATGERGGRIVNTNARATVNNVRFKNLLQILAYTTPGQEGDSGGPVLYESPTGYYQMVGIQKGGHPEAPTLEIASRADKVQSLLGLTFGAMPPLAVAGENRLRQATHRVNLDGIQSRERAHSIFDPFTALDYHWRQHFEDLNAAENTPRVQLFNNNSFRSYFFAPVSERRETLDFELTVTDGYNQSHSDIVTVTVNQLPIIDVGPDRTVRPRQLVKLDASNSRDPEETPLTFLWTQGPGPRVDLLSHRGRGQRI